MIPDLDDDESDDDSLEYKELEPRTCSGWFASCCIATVCCPCTWLCGFFSVPPKTEVIVSYWGRPYRVVKKPGTYHYNVIGRSNVRVSTALLDYRVEKRSVNDIHGNPLNISALVNYLIEDTVKSTFEVNDISKFMVDQTCASLRDVAARYPYDAEDLHGNCLRRPTDSLNAELFARSAQTR